MNPHTLVCYRQEDGYEDENGYYHEGASYEECSIPCKAVADSGKDNVVTFENGKIAKKTFVCYLHHPRVFHFGERVKLILTDGIENEYLVAGFIPYQLKSKVWLAI